MTIEQLCECSAEQLEQMSDAQLLEHFKQFLDVTRPEYAARVRQQTKPSENQKTSMLVLSPQKQAALRQLSQETGMDFDFLLRRKKK